ncbi:MAG: hypothetical protein EOM40_04960 [Clostridia bacterium]|nr:hypothetical protein [Clostridia bacterium]
MRKKHNYWQSYSDLMAALVLVLFLIVAVSMKSLTGYEDEMNKQKEALKKQEEIMIAKEAEYQQISSKVSDLESELDEKRAEIERIIGVKADIIKALEEKFKANASSLTIDAETGAIIFDSDIFFQKDRSVLKNEGEQSLDSFLPIYLRVLLSDEYADSVAEIIIEGHCDTDGGFQYNLDLSQDRALSVAYYSLDCSESILNADQQEMFRKKLTANGKSYSNPIYDSNGNISKAKSRRVEFKFRLKDEEMIEELRSLLK